MSALLSKVTDLRDSTRQVLVELDDVLDAVILGVIGGKNVYMLGAPGIAKSFLVDQLVARIDNVRYFKDQFHKTMTVEAVNGPIDVPEFKKGRYVRSIDGYAPSSDIAFFDELFLASASLLTSTMMFLNERQFRQGSQLIDVPTKCVIAASNQLPEEGRDELAAMYDRLTIRVVVEEVQTAAGFRRMLRLQVPETPPKVITWAEIVDAQEEAAKVPVSDDAIDALFEVRRGVSAAGIRVSPRKWRQAEQLLSTAAWLAGDVEAGPEHGDFLEHVLWGKPEERSVVTKVVLSVVDPGRVAALESRDAALDIAENVDKAIDSDDLGAINALYSEVKKKRLAVAKAAKAAKGKTGRTYTEVGVTLDNLQRRLAAAYGLDVDSLTSDMGDL